MKFNPARWWRHAAASPARVRRAFPPAAFDRIAEAIAASELTHRGEIRFAVEAALPWSYVRRDASARERATMVFAKLRVWDTEENNGVLVYVELADRAIEIVADRGIARRVAQPQWDAVAHAMRERFATGDFSGGAVAGVTAVGAILAAHFPAAAGERNPDELSNRPVAL